MPPLKYFLNFLVSIPHTLNVWLIFPSLALLVLADIGLRSINDTPIQWAHEVLGLLLLSLFFLELPRCFQRRGLLSVDILYLRFGYTGKLMLNIISTLLMLVFAVLVAWQGGVGVIDSWQYEDQAYTLPIPYWPFYLLISFSGIVTTIQLLILLTESKGEQQKENPFA